ncbi:MAG: FHA domain-containing protein [Cyanobacteria bacterium P01_H01_bin.21]
MKQSWLIVDDVKGQRKVALDSSLYALGRDADRCDIRLASQFVSRHHATLVQLCNDDNTCYYRIVDGNLKGKLSANGILVNGRKREAYDLQHEDEIVFGPQARAVYYTVDPEASDRFHSPVSYSAAL